MQLTNEERAKVFAMYWGQKIVKHKENNGTGSPVGNALSLLTMGMFNIDNYVLLLTSLKDISDEHARVVIKMETLSHFEFDGKKTDKAIYYSFDNGDRWQSSLVDLDNLTATQHQYLISKGYDIPLYFSPDHWANSKTAIELGIAIEKKD